MFQAPEICEGLVKKLQDSGNEFYDEYFLRLDHGELYFFDPKSDHSASENAIETVDLDGFVVSFPSEATLLLTSIAIKNQITLKQENNDEFDKWAIAFFEHLEFMNSFTGNNGTLSAAEIENEQSDESQVEKNELDSHSDFIDPRGIRMCTQQEVLENLSKKSDEDEDKFEFNENLSLEEIKSKIIYIFQNESLEVDNKYLNYLLECLDRHPDYKNMKEQESENWKEKFEPYTIECLRKMRTFIPPHIFSSTTFSLTNFDKIKEPLAKRFMAKKCLWLVRISQKDISKIHIADLLHKFNPQAQGLDLIELAAVFASLPSSFLYDTDGRKEKWRESIEECLKSLLNDYKEGVISDERLRNSAYESQEEGSFSPEEVYVKSIHSSNHRNSFANYRQSIAISKPRI